MAAQSDIGELAMLSTRAGRAQQALAAYRNQISPKDPDCQSDEELLIDMVADLMHLASELGLDADDTLKLGRPHFNAEKRAA
jgi:hypothetical protein